MTKQTDDAEMSTQGLITALTRIVERTAHAPRERTTLGILLLQNDEVEEAERHFTVALEQDPSWTDAHEGLGSVAIKRGDFASARPHFLHVIELAPENLSARFALYDIEQALHNIPAALAHQSQILSRQQLFTIRAPHELRRMLILLAPGDWQANVPVDFLIDFGTTTVHKFYLVPGAAEQPLPQADLVFCAIGESDASAPLLEHAQRIIATLGVPVLNSPSAISRTSRTGIVDSLGGLNTTVVTSTIRCSRSLLRDTIAERHDDLLIRPVDSHAGHGLERFEFSSDRSDRIQAYMERVPSANYYVTPFIDYRNADGFYRKYRMICVDGEPYPFHLAISPNWMIHYYNAPMREHLWMREEEQRFLADSPGAMGTTAHTALREIAARSGLEYVGIDCSVLPDGRLLVFEVDPAMIVHHLGSGGIFAYHIPYARAIYSAFEHLMDRLRARP